MCFVHVLLNGINMNEKGYEIKIIMEGKATSLIKDLIKMEHPLHVLWERAKDLSLIEGVTNC
ncbi:MAG: hypothetical protein HQK76_04215 [Desulfobacterales bacterium]|nr:hypothetical protein [Desulfobacterales bacterium]